MNFETLFIGLVIIIQFWVYLKTRGKIRFFAGKAVPAADLEVLTSKASVNLEGAVTKTEVFELYSNDDSDVQTQIKDSINTYLSKNKGATTEISLLKNIIDRNVAKLENDINSLIPIPLYLGLIGTMLGIVIGLFQIPSVSSVDFTEGDGIDVLIDGVKYAMIASMVGVILTTYLSGVLLRNAKYKVEGLVSDLLTFLETELLPILKEDVESNLRSLYQNLSRFNSGFNHNVERLQGIMNKNYDSLMAQERVMDTLQNIDIQQIAKANIVVFKEMQQLMPNFKALNGYVGKVNNSIAASESLTNKLNGVLDRTGQVEEIARYVSSATDQSVQLNKLVETYFDGLQDRTAKFTTATVAVEDETKRTVEHFKAFVEEQIKSLREVTLKEEDLMIKAFEKNRNILDKLNELTEIRQSIRTLADRPEVSITKDVDRILETLQNIEKLNQKAPNRLLSFYRKWINSDEKV
ncbi:MAG: hypothetical protein AAFQ94_20135 [Bacteroidota bacterium]